MLYFLDTNICAYFINGNRNVISKIIRIDNGENIKIPSMVAAELRYGVEKSKLRDFNFKRVEEFLAHYDVVSFEEDATVIYGKIRATLEKQGMIIGLNDLVIASTVMSFSNAVLVTHNVGEFNRIEKLEVEDWYV